MICFVTYRFSAQALDAVNALTDIGRLVEDAENRAVAVEYTLTDTAYELNMYVPVYDGGGGSWGKEIDDQAKRSDEKNKWFWNI